MSTPSVFPDTSLVLDSPAEAPGLTETGLSAADLLRELPAQVLLLGQDRRIRWANDAFCRLSNVTPAQIVGRPVAEFLSNLDAHSMFFSRAFAGEAVEFPLN
ncbi:MAG TPA: PAS domain-containing protein, partial [Povalibacter sp.]